MKTDSVQNSLFDRPVFIWGCPRSGTTLMYQLLSSSGGWCYPKDDQDKHREGTGAWWAAFGEERGAIDPQRKSEEKIDQLISAYSDLVGGSDDGRLLDKSPMMTLWVPLIDSIFPEAHHIHMIRDGRAVLNSILYKLRWSKSEKDRAFQSGEKIYGPQSPGMLEVAEDQLARRHAQQWVDLVQAGRSWAELLGDRYHEVRYESLVADPRGEMPRLVSAIDAQPQPGWVESLPESLPNKNELWSDPNLTADDQVFTKHSSLTPADVPAIESMAEMLDQLGYPPSGDIAQRLGGFDKYRRAGAYHWTQSQRIWGNKRFNAPLAGRYEAVLSSISAQGTPPGRILDIGCGDGYLLYAASTQAKGAELTGIDAEPLALRLAEEKLHEHGRTATLRQDDCTAMQFPDDSFDLAMCADVIEHLEERERCVAEAARVLASDGVLLLSTPNRLPGIAKGAYHTHEYDGPELLAVLGRYFEHVEIFYAWPTRWMERWNTPGRSRKLWRLIIKLMCQVGRNPFAIMSKSASVPQMQLIARASGPLPPASREG